MRWIMFSVVVALKARSGPGPKLCTVPPPPVSSGRSRGHDPRPGEPLGPRIGGAGRRVDTGGAPSSILWAQDSCTPEGEHSASGPVCRGASLSKGRPHGAAMARPLGLADGRGSFWFGVRRSLRPRGGQGFFGDLGATGITP